MRPQSQCAAGARFPPACLDSADEWRRSGGFSRAGGGHRLAPVPLVHRNAGHGIGLVARSPTMTDPCADLRSAVLAPASVSSDWKPPAGVPKYIEGT
jgi:hypothetical protein